MLVGIRERGAKAMLVYGSGEADERLARLAAWHEEADPGSAFHSLGQGSNRWSAAPQAPGFGGSGGSGSKMST